MSDVESAYLEGRTEFSFRSRTPRESTGTSPSSSASSTGSSDTPSISSVFADWRTSRQFNYTFDFRSMVLSCEGTGNTFAVVRRPHLLAQFSQLQAHKRLWSIQKTIPVDELNGLSPLFTANFSFYTLMPLHIKIYLYFWIDLLNCL